VELQRQGVRFHKDDNAFLSVSDPQALQAAADRLSPSIIRPRLDYWTLVLVRPEIFQEGAHRYRLTPSLFPESGRVLSQFRLPAQLSHPQAISALC
jgi:hypothetical protein